jgi:hypothetical protein
VGTCNLHVGRREVLREIGKRRGENEIFDFCESFQPTKKKKKKGKIISSVSKYDRLKKSVALSSDLSFYKPEI